MRRLLLIPVLLAAGGLIGLWALGGFDVISGWAAEGQRQFQNAMARSLRALKGGHPGALMALLGVCFAYGFFHAVGPGHGKVLIGGYGVGRQVRMAPLMGIALASSLAQSTTAVALVYAGVFVFNWTREQMVGVTEDIMAPISYAAIGLIGLWLVWRGLRRLWRMHKADRHAHDHHHHDHDHDHHHHADGAVCESCGHAHGPSIEQVAQLTGWRDTLLLIGGIALRPCTGALFVLILTWRMGIELAGIAAAYAMGLGTASVTVLVAVLAVSLRGGAFQALSDSRATRHLVPALELAAGALVALVALQLFRMAI